MKNALLTVSLFCFLTHSNAQIIFSENFDSVSTMLSTGGWTEQNNSLPLGAETWHNGLYLSIPAFNGDTNSYGEVSFESTDSIGDISNWLISPAVSLRNGDEISFYTTSDLNAIFPDRLELRLNSSNTTNVGSSPFSTGDFGTLLLSVNPNLLNDTSTYPQGYWGRFSATISGLAGPTNCRIAFRYFVVNGGVDGDNSSTIGVDAFSINRPIASIHNPETGSISVYPNPAADYLTVGFPSAISSPGIMQLYNATGRLLHSFMIQPGQAGIRFNVASIVSGVYFLSLESSDVVWRKQFLKK